MKRHADKFGRKSKGPGPGPEIGKRKPHKAAIVEARKVAEHDKKHPEPMSIIRKREKDLPISHVKPEVTPGKVETAAAALASWDNSDPFAYGRAALHLRQGYLDPAEVIKEYGMRVIARRAAKVREVEGQHAIAA